MPGYSNWSLQSKNWCSPWATHWKPMAAFGFYQPVLDFYWQWYSACNREILVDNHAVHYFQWSVQARSCTMSTDHCPLSRMFLFIPHWLGFLQMSSSLADWTMVLILFLELLLVLWHLGWTTRNSPLSNRNLTMSELTRLPSPVWIFRNEYLCD